MLGILGESALFSGGTAMESRGTHRPYGPPPGLLGLIYGLSSGQEIPHFPSLGLFCNGKLHHLPNLRDISMGRYWRIELVSWKFCYYGRAWKIRSLSVWFSLILTISKVSHGLLQLFKTSSLKAEAYNFRTPCYQWWYIQLWWWSMANSYSAGFSFHWFHPFSAPAVLTMPVIQNCSMIPTPSNTWDKFKMR